MRTGEHGDKQLSGILDGYPDEREDGHEEVDKGRTNKGTKSCVVPIECRA